MRILLVDDDDGVLQSLAVALKSLPGHEVRTAVSGEQAQQEAQALGGLDLLITDVVMDPMDGFALRDALTAQHPGLRTILVTGFDLSDYTEQTQGHQLLQKPFEPADLVAAVRKEIGDNGAAPVAAPAPPTPVAEPPPVPAPAVVAPAPVVEPPLPPQEIPAPAVPVTVPRVAAATQPTPVARPATQPLQPRQATTAPRATAVPPPTARAAQPTATPGQARAVARPTAVSGAPTAVPGATAVPVPTAVAKAVPVAGPAVPVAVPKAKSTTPIAAPAATAVPVAKAAPTAVPTAVPQARAVPVAKPSAVTPTRPAVATAKPSVPPQPGVSAAMPPHAPPPPDTSDLPAKNIGAYEIHHRLGVGRTGAVYAAVQTAINRPVALKILDPEQAKKEEMVQRFTATARAKAGVQNPSILAVYEAGEQDGHIFYTREYVAGRNLAEVEKSGAKIDEPTALKILRVAGEGLAYFQAQNLAHTTLEARSIYVGTDGTPRLANLATQAGDEPQTFEQEVQTLGKMLLSVLPAAQKLAPGLRGLLSRMVQTTAGNPKSFQDWPQVVQSVKSLEPKFVPVEAAQISAQDRAAVAAVEAARKAQKRSLYFTVGSMASLLVLVGAAVWFFFFRGSEREHEEMIHIPAGDFLFQAGDPATIPEFWIDKYEVTIGQYAKFLKDLDDHPRGQFADLYERIEHINQPPLKRVEGGHRPPNWHIFYPRAKGKMEVAGTPTSLNSPVVEVDWWSAHAYAKWKGRELPTEQEWEKAARGTKGLAYPWGEELDPKRVNSGADYHGGNPNAKAELDGFIRYGDVDQQASDKSPFGVIGMAGNVSEWIGGDWATAPDKRTKFPIIKGGNFALPDVKLDRRIIDRRPDAVHDWLGFRTVGHSAPKE